MYVYKGPNHQFVMALDAATCLALAEACCTHADHIDNGDSANPQHVRTEAEYFVALKAAFEGYALLDAAIGSMTISDGRALSLETVRAEYGVMHADRSAS